jgi:hypothetical protein
LGPQRLVTTLGAELAALPYRGRIAAITAGWQEREAEDEELQSVVGHRAVNLRLHARGDAVFQEDRELFVAHRQKQDVLRKLQDVYRTRLVHALAAVTQLQALELEPALVGPELVAAIETVRAVDARHLARVDEVDAEFRARVNLFERPSVAKQRRELRHLLSHCELVAVAGGQVATLVNRLRLFGLEPELAARPTIAWSAGAMAISERIVLFHDDAVDGRSGAEVLCSGLGLVKDVVALPHASRRLRLSEPANVGAFAQRFTPARCVALDERGRFRQDGASEEGGPATRVLRVDGAVTPWEGAS